MKVLSAAVLAVALAAAAGVEPEEVAPRIADFRVELEGDNLVVAYAVEGGLAGEALERIDSGIPITFRHRVELEQRRTLFLWPARTLAAAEVETTAIYDSLTRRYQLVRRIDRKNRLGTVAAGVYEQRSSSASTDEMRAWMSTFPPTPIVRLADLPQRERLRVRAESSLGRRYLLYLVPGRVTVSAEQRLELP